MRQDRRGVRERQVPGRAIVRGQQRCLRHERNQRRAHLRAGAAACRGLAAVRRGGVARFWRCGGRCGVVRIVLTRRHRQGMAGAMRSRGVVRRADRPLAPRHRHVHGHLHRRVRRPDPFQDQDQAQQYAQQHGRYGHRRTITHREARGMFTGVGRLPRTASRCRDTDRAFAPPQRYGGGVFCPKNTGQ